ncbi:PPE domain-containing protein [Actinokineospora iranica]|uniref:PPE family protein n=1 Tax=Actinokineospora iranica TaxID=1271860 RepID=A0A1G6QBR1_9PSEU|nr:PPE domain-containing protein [Actinokineospora iranica]SDC89115.1 PPE family protein [Actinokineospora iranica]
MAMHRWRGYDHPTLHAMINGGPGPAASTPQTAYWEALAAELAEIDADLNTKLSTMQATWEGGAADQAHAGLTPLQAWAGDAQSGATGMRASTEYQADMIARARAEMPEPVEVTTPKPSGWQMVTAGAALLTGDAGPAAAVAGQAQDHEAQEAQQDAASQKAVDTMESYQSSSQFNTNTLGTFVPPPDVVIATPAPAGGTGYAVGTFGAAFTNPSTGSGTSAAAFAPAQAAPPSGGAQFTPLVAGGQHGSFTPPSVSGAVTTPSGFVPPSSSTAPAGFTQPSGGAQPPRPTVTTFNSALSTGSPVTGGGQFTPGGVPVGGVNSAQGLGGGNSSGAKGGIGSGAGAPGGIGADSTRQGAQIGRGGMAGAFGGAGGETALGGRTAAGAQPGRGGIGGPLGAGGRGAADEDDDNYESATYLVETEDLYGDDRTVSQAVLGGSDT